MVYIVFYVTIVLLATVHLRTSSSRIFNRYRYAQVQQERLREQLRQKQLELEGLINPSAVSDQIPQKDTQSQER